MGHFQLLGAIASFGWYYFFFSESECVCAYFCLYAELKMQLFQSHFYISSFYYNLCLVIIAVAVQAAFR